MRAVSHAYPARPADLTAPGTSRSVAAELTSLTLVNDAGDEVVCIRPHEPISAMLEFRLHRPICSLVVELNLRASAGENVLSFNSGRDGLTFDARAGKHQVILALPQIPLAGGQYFWNVRQWEAKTGEILLDTPLRFPMTIDDEGRATGVMTLDHKWSYTPLAPQPVMAKGETAECAAVQAD